MANGFSRRSFLRNTAIGAAALQFPAGALAFAQSAEPPRSRMPGGPILLNSNENAYGSPASVMAAMREALQHGNRYPDHQYDAYINRVAALHNVPPHQALPGCGSTEILRLCATAFLAPGKRLIMAAPTFEAIESYARMQGADVVKVPLTKDFAHDLDAMLAQATKPEPAALIYICNPNNPTASLTPRKNLDAFLAKLPDSTYVLMDEAYHHFATSSPDYTSYLERPLQDARVIVARTFSKIYGMAGIRLGYGIALPETTQRMRPFVLQDNVNMVAALAGVAALDDAAAMQAAAARNARDREEFFRQAATRQLTAIPSFANFVMLESGRPVRQIIEHFKRNNILVGRRFPAMENYVRVSLALPEEMQEFWRVWDMLPGHA